MNLTPTMAVVLCVGMICLTGLVLHGDLPAMALTHLLAALVGAFSPGTYQQIKASLHPPPYRPPPTDLPPSDLQR